MNAVKYFANFTLNDPDGLQNILKGYYLMSRLYYSQEQTMY